MGEAENAGQLFFRVNGVTRNSIRFEGRMIIIMITNCKVSDSRSLVRFSPAFVDSLWPETERYAGWNSVTIRRENDCPANVATLQNDR